MPPEIYLIVGMVLYFTHNRGADFVQYLVQAPEATGQGTGRSQHRDSRRRSRRERLPSAARGTSIRLHGFVCAGYGTCS